VKIEIRRSTGDESINMYVDDKGASFTTEKDEVDYNFVADNFEATTEEMDEICRLWRQFRNR